MPATAAVVIVGDALAGNGSAGMIALSAVLFSLGVVGLLIDTWLGAPGGTKAPGQGRTGNSPTGA